jgi:hypothetical protein
MENNIVHRHIHIHGLGTAAQCLAWAAIIFFIAQCHYKEAASNDHLQEVKAAHSEQSPK